METNGGLKLLFPFKMVWQSTSTSSLLMEGNGSLIADIHRQEIAAVTSITILIFLKGKERKLLKTMQFKEKLGNGFSMILEGHAESSTAFTKNALAKTHKFSCTNKPKILW
jgi:hypothetical protein